MEKKQTVIALIAALIVFLLLFFVLKWNWGMATIITLLSYLAVFYLVKPVVRIGKLEIDEMEDGLELKRLMDEAEHSKNVIKNFSENQADTEMKRRSAELVFTTESILRYLNNHPEKITRARKFLGYYVSTGANLVKRFDALNSSGVETETLNELYSETGNALTVLNQLFKKQFNSLVQNEIVDMQADIDLIENIMNSEVK